MFSTFTFKFLASFVLVAVVAMGAAGPAEAGKKKPEVPGHWERSQDGGFEWVGRKKQKPKNVEPVVRDHRNDAGGGGVTVSNSPEVRDHRAQPEIRDHRAGSETGGTQKVARDSRKKKYIGVPWPF